MKVDNFIELTTYNAEETLFDLSGYLKDAVSNAVA
jgi:hypothetical protein